MFDLRVVGEKRVIFDEAVYSVSCDGIDSEFEFLSFHANTSAVLGRGEIVINSKEKIRLRNGVVDFRENKCLILIKEA